MSKVQLDHQLLYIGKADNLRTRWNSHHKYQYFIETSMECRIGYFTFDSIDNLNETIEQIRENPYLQYFIGLNLGDGLFSPEG